MPTNKRGSRGKCLIKGKVGGTGKSYTGEYFKKLGYNALFVVGTNQLSQEKECEAITLNKFFSPYGERRRTTNI